MSATMTPSMTPTMTPTTGNMAMMGNMQMINTMPMMMGKMKCTMTATGMMWELMPLEGMSKEMFMEYCKAMSKATINMPMMMNCGGLMMMCMPMLT
ncbi:MAG: hypothetical protein H7061_14740 [Bdellovibrionaceae bacterium]|nr:hypothetical protein [Bdellovibrio sp.]